MDVREIITAELKAMNVDETTLSLWDEIAGTYEESGPDGVKALLTEKVKSVKKSAVREAREMTEVAGIISKSKKRGK
jgi:hypothetical protein